MFDRINASFELQKTAITLRDERQKLLANNIANADTPDFKARDIDFQAQMNKAFSRTTSSASGGVAATSNRHITSDIGNTVSGLETLYRVPAQSSLDGNTVDMDKERTDFLDNSVKYQASLVMMNNYIQGIRAAIQPER